MRFGKLDHCILFSYSSDANEWVFQSDGQIETVLVSGGYRVNNSEVLREALAEGIGIGRLPTFVAGPDLKSGRLLRLFEHFHIPDHTFYAVFPERQYLPAMPRFESSWILRWSTSEEIIPIGMPRLSPIRP